jgi:serine/threonine-protein kinase TTK/MPS1
MNAANEIFAIKRVSLDKTDADTMSGYMNEIALLKRLDGNHRIIRLFDSELKPGPGGTKGHLLLVMELGEIGTLRWAWVGLGVADGGVLADLAKLLQEQQKEPMNMVWISYYWQQASYENRSALVTYRSSLAGLIRRCCKRCTSYTKRRSCTPI